MHINGHINGHNGESELQLARVPYCHILRLNDSLNESHLSRDVQPYESLFGVYELTKVKTQVFNSSSDCFLSAS